MSSAAILGRLETQGIRLGLDSTRELLASLGDPQLRYPSVLIAGSNGKGSTSSLLAAIASAAGYRTGLYTSPHLESVVERLRIDGRAVGDDRLGALLGKVVASAGRRGAPLPTYFEALTAAAFLWFAEQRVELAVVEVGMGGRLDATNLCDPSVSVITSISLDHREHLGDTLAEIAREKAGILRQGRPALTWVDRQEAAAAIAGVARACGARLREVSREVEVTILETGRWTGQRVRVATPESSHVLDIPLLGDHQARNLALAVRAAEALQDLGFHRLNAAAIAAGAAAWSWPGRLEPVALPALPATPRRVLLDAAHNAEGAGTLAAFLGQLAARAAEPAGGSGPQAGGRGTGDLPIDVLFGVLSDKDAGEMLAAIAPCARHLILTTPASSRARPPEELAERVRNLPPIASPGGRVIVEPERERALACALSQGGGTLVACGSIFLVGEIRALLRKAYGVPPPAAADLVR